MTMMAKEAIIVNAPAMSTMLMTTPEKVSLRLVFTS
jgi:hypothetical protein